MIRSTPVLAYAGSVLVLSFCSGPLEAQLSEPPGANPKVRALSHGRGRDLPSAGSLRSAPAGAGVAEALGVVDCLPRCDWCWLGSPQDCFPEYADDGECDCGCQFADNGDCGSNCSCPSACVWCWCNTTAQNACPLSWNGDGECDCACQFADIDCAGPTPTGACCNANGNCSVTSAQACSSAYGAYQGNNTLCAQINCRARCEAGCDFCWEGTPLEGACDPDWEGDGECDCGCQFNDPDCGPEGACCAPGSNACVMLTEATCRLYAVGVFHGVGVGCAQVNCNRCDPGCAWCWVDTIREHACFPEWAGDAECDCGCQFPDPDCGSGVCGNLVCEENATSCADDCKDLRAFAGFQNCFDPGQATPQECMVHVFAAPTGIGLEDFHRFADLMSGP